MTVPAAICKGYVITASSGMRNASTDSAAAGGTNSFADFIIMHTMSIVTPAAANIFQPSSVKTDLHTAPTSAQPAIRAC